MSSKMKHMESSTERKKMYKTRIGWLVASSVLMSVGAAAGMSGVVHADNVLTPKAANNPSTVKDDTTTPKPSAQVTLHHTATPTVAAVVVPKSQSNSAKTVNTSAMQSAQTNLTNAVTAAKKAGVKVSQQATQTTTVPESQESSGAQKIVNDYNSQTKSVQQATTQQQQNVKNYNKDNLIYQAEVQQAKEDKGAALKGIPSSDIHQTMVIDHDSNTKISYDNLDPSLVKSVQVDTKTSNVGKDNGIYQAVSNGDYITKSTEGLLVDLNQPNTETVNKPFLSVTYTNLNSADQLNGQKIDKIVATYNFLMKGNNTQIAENKSNPNKPYLYIYNDFADGFFYANCSMVGVNYQFYNAQGKVIDANGNSYFTVKSLNNSQGKHIEGAILNTPGKALALKYSTVNAYPITANGRGSLPANLWGSHGIPQSVKGNLLISESSNTITGNPFLKLGIPNGWDNTSSPYQYFGAGVFQWSGPTLGIYYTQSNMTPNSAQSNGTVWVEYSTTIPLTPEKPTLQQASVNYHLDKLEVTPNPTTSKPSSSTKPATSKPSTSSTPTPTPTKPSSSTSTPTKPSTSTEEPVSQTKQVPVTIHYIYGSGPKKGQTAAPTVTKEETFTRKGTKNEVTGQTTWDNWTPTQTVNPIKSPTIPDYTPTASESKTFKVSYDSPAQSQTIYYNPTTEPVSQTKQVPVTIHYIYGSGPKKGQTAAPTVTKDEPFTRKGTKNEVTGQTTWGDWTPATQTVGPVKSPTIPDYTPTASESQPVTVNPNSPAQSQTIYYNPTTEPVSQTKEVPVTIHYIYGSGPKKGQLAAPTVTKEETFTRKGTKNEVTGKTTWGNWTPATQTAGSVASPTIPGYTPTASESQPVTVNPNSPAQNQTIYYNPTTEPVSQTNGTPSNGTMEAPGESSPQKMVSESPMVSSNSGSEMTTPLKKGSSLVANQPAANNEIPQLGDKRHVGATLLEGVSLVVAGVVASLGLAADKKRQ